MKIAYIDCSAGISGDMFVGALLDLGLDVEYLKKELNKTGLTGFSIKAYKEKRKGISGTRFIVNVKTKQKERSLKEILKLINKRKKAGDLFNLLSHAEAKVHGVDINDVHFHEVGAVDSIIDIVGAAIGVEKLGVDAIYASPVKLGNIQPPAVMELLKGIPVVGINRDVEMVTPTGAVFLKGFVRRFCPLPEMKIENIGYGIGSRDDKDLPNVLRIVIGEKIPSADSIYVIETNIDDMNPQRYGTLMDKIFSRGALDVFWTPVQMKKNRPGILVTVLCAESLLDDMIKILFSETTTFGVRYYRAERRILDRETKKIEGRRVKIGSYKGKVYTVSPEYEDWKDVQGEALHR